ncbi:MAG: ATP-binding protein, partial [Chloroflexota bacterium]
GWRRPMTTAAPSAIHVGLLAALSQVGDRVRALAEERLAGGAEAADAFRGLHVDPGQIEQVLAGPTLLVAPPSDTRDEIYVLPPEAEHSPLGVAQRLLGLSAFETAVTVLCLLPEVDARYGQLFGFLHDDITRKDPSVELALALFAPSGSEQLSYLSCFAAESRLRQWQLLKPPGDDPLVKQQIILERGFLWYLLGETTMHPGIAGLARTLTEDQHLPLPGGVVAMAGESLTDGTPPFLHGEDEQNCLAVAAAAATRAQRPLLVIDGARLIEREEIESLLQRCLREAVLKGFTPCVTGAAELLRHATHGEHCRRQLLRCPIIPILVSREDQGGVAYGGAGVVPVAVPAPLAEDRLIRWHEVAQIHGLELDERAFLALSETDGLSGSLIEEVALVAKAGAVAAGEPADIRHVQVAARAALRHNGPSLTLLAPRFGWDDIVLPPDRLTVLRHLCSRVRYRSRVQHDWGMGRGVMPGVTALFAGQPGTGKSMAAEVIANDLGLDVCKIDLAQVISKYIGETEKNLGKIFDESERCGVVLVFDEADALFGKRSDVKDSHDRYANVETSYLLQRMERYRGLAVLTTNMRANLDEAFIRRIGVSIDFPLPEAADRLRLWKRALGQAPCEPDLALAEVAERLELAGGSIVSAALAAAYLAAEEHCAVSSELLIRAVRWEQQKAGRLMASDALDVLLPAHARSRG